MSQKTETKIEYFTSDIFHKKSDADSIKLVEGISESQVYRLNGKIVNHKKLSFGKLIQTKVSGISGWHRFDEAFSRKMHSDRFTPKSVFSVLEDVVDKYDVKVGDVIMLQEWKWYAPESSVQGRDSTFYLITDDEFKPFSRATGEWI